MYMYMYDILIRLLTPLSAASSPSCAQLARDVPGVAIEPLAWALAFGACFGGNGTLIGARFAPPSPPFYPTTHPPTYLFVAVLRSRRGLLPMSGRGAQRPGSGWSAMGFY
jgi:hypothetical protein